MTRNGGIRCLSLFVDLAGGLIVLADMDLAGLPVDFAGIEFGC